MGELLLFRENLREFERIIIIASLAQMLKQVYLFILFC